MLGRACISQGCREDREGKTRVESTVELMGPGKEKTLNIDLSLLDNGEATLLQGCGFDQHFLVWSLASDWKLARGAIF